MATFDMTASTTAGVSSDSIAVLPGSRPGTGMRMIESILDISKITDYSCTDGDIFQLWFSLQEQKYLLLLMVHHQL